MFEISLKMGESIPIIDATMGTKIMPKEAKTIRWFRGAQDTFWLATKNIETALGNKRDVTMFKKRSTSNLPKRGKSMQPTG